MATGLGFINRKNCNTNSIQRFRALYVTTLHFGVYSICIIANKRLPVRARGDTQTSCYCVRMEVKKKKKKKVIFQIKREHESG